MNSILRVLRMAGDSENRYWTVIFLAGVDLVCLFEAGDSFRERQWRDGAIWLLIATSFSLIGYHWPRIKQRLPFGKGERGKRKVSISAAAMRESLLLSELRSLRTPEEKSMGRTDWLQLAKDFESCPKQVIAEWYRYGNPPIDKWQVGSWAQDDRCKSLCSLAGATLLGSPRVRAKLPEQVRSVSEPMYRWLYFLKERRGLNDYMAAVEPLDDGSKAGVYAGRIVNLAEVSAAACIECAARET